MIFFDQICQKKRGFWSKREKVNNTIEFCMFELVQPPSFSLHGQFWFSFNQICPKRSFPLHLCVRPWSLLTILNFSARGPKLSHYICVHNFLLCFILILQETSSTVEQTHIPLKSLTHTAYRCIRWFSAFV